MQATWTRCIGSAVTLAKHWRHPPRPSWCRRPGHGITAYISEIRPDADLVVEIFVPGG